MVCYYHWLMWLELPASILFGFGSITALLIIFRNVYFTGRSREIGILDAVNINVRPSNTLPPVWHVCYRIFLLTRCGRRCCVGLLRYQQCV